MINIKFQTMSDEEPDYYVEVKAWIDITYDCGETVGVTAPSLDD